MFTVYHLREDMVIAAHFPFTMAGYTGFDFIVFATMKRQIVMTSVTCLHGDQITRVGDFT